MGESAKTLFSLHSVYNEESYKNLYDFLSISGFNPGGGGGQIKDSISGGVIVDQVHAYGENALIILSCMHGCNC